MRRLSIVLLAISLTACSAQDGAEPELTSDGLPTMSVQQTQFLSHGEVTFEEYEAGYRAFLTCMANSGYPVEEGGIYGNVYDSYPDAANESGDYEACYVPHFTLLDETWQIANQDLSYSTQAMKNCLVQHGIEPKETTEEVDEQLKANNIPWEDCLANLDLP